MYPHRLKPGLNRLGQPCKAHRSGIVPAFHRYQHNREKGETVRGLNYKPLGLIGHAELREIIFSDSQYFRDWQHTYCSNGVASVQLGYVLNKNKDDAVLKRERILW